jgi:predicted RNA-binding Zn-ribbon protein involved in translation (DUF1610 family)
MNLGWALRARWAVCSSTTLIDFRLDVQREFFCWDKRVMLPYQTNHSNGQKCLIDFVIWSEQFSCPECGAEINFLDEALDRDSKEVLSEFPCPECNAALTKKKMDRVFETSVDHSTGKPWRHIKYKPTEIHYKHSGKKFSKKPDGDDLKILSQVQSRAWPVNVPTNAFPISKMYHGSRIEVDPVVEAIF